MVWDCKFRQLSTELRALIDVKNVSALYLEHFLIDFFQAWELILGMSFWIADGLILPNTHRVIWP